MEDLGTLFFFIAALIIYAVYQVVKIMKRDKISKKNLGNTVSEKTVPAIIPINNSFGKDDPYDFGKSGAFADTEGNERPEMTVKELWMAANAQRTKMQAEARNQNQTRTGKLEAVRNKALYSSNIIEDKGDVDEYLIIAENEFDDSHIASSMQSNEISGGSHVNNRIVDDFDLKKAIIYSEILTPKF